MKIAVFSTKSYDKEFLEKENPGQYQFSYFEPHLSSETAALAQGHEVVCVFVNDVVNAEVVASLAKLGIKLLALRCAGFNNVDLKACAQHQIPVVRVPAYSPYSVAEHTVGLMLTLNRKIHRAYNRVKEGNFSLEGLIGFDMHQRTVGIVGAGKIGKVTAKILQGFGCKILYFDLQPDKECDGAGMEFSTMENIYAEADIISLHCPLTPDTKHLINKNTLAQMKDGVMLVNTSRGGLIDTKAVINALKKSKVGYLALDVYEEEGDLFFEDLSNTVISDDIFSRLLTFPNVLVTGHQAFFTKEAMTGIMKTTLQNISDFKQGKKLVNVVEVKA